MADIVKCSKEFVRLFFAACVSLSYPYIGSKAGVPSLLKATKCILIRIQMIPSVKCNKTNLIREENPVKSFAEILEYLAKLIVLLKTK